MPLGSLQKGSFDVTGAQVEVVPFATPPVSGLGGDNVSLSGVSMVSSNSMSSLATQSTTSNRKPNTPEWRLRIKPANQAHLIELGVETKEDAIEWCNTIK